MKCLRQNFYEIYAAGSDNNKKCLRGRYESPCCRMSTKARQTDYRRSVTQTSRRFRTLIAHTKLSLKREFRKNRHSENHVLLTGVNEIFITLSQFLSNFGRS
jgi:hypothetical protein